MTNNPSLPEKQIEIFPDATALSAFGANLFAQIAQKAVSARGLFFTALSGGGTPMALYRLLAESPYQESLPWDKMHFFWGDERCVPPDNSESCYFQVYSMWLGQVPIPTENIHRAKGELGPETAAADYAHELKKVAEITEDWPRIDLVFLGLGADGHTAVIAVRAHYQDRPANRISMTPIVFNSARNVVFLVSGTEKENALADTITGSFDPLRLPAQRIQPDNGKIWWLVDDAAGRLLSRNTQ
jgi:6-phosphogluconolactonase